MRSLWDRPKRCPDEIECQMVQWLTWGIHCKFVWMQHRAHPCASCGNEHRWQWRIAMEHEWQWQFLLGKSSTNRPLSIAMSNFQTVGPFMSWFISICPRSMRPCFACPKQHLRLVPINWCQMNGVNRLTAAAEPMWSKFPGLVDALESILLPAV